MYLILKMFSTYNNSRLIIIYYIYVMLIIIHLSYGIQWNKVKSMYFVSSYHDEADASSGDNIMGDVMMPGITLMDVGDHLMRPQKKYAMNRIFGGSEAPLNSFAYQVGFLLQRPRGLYWCGGSLISHEYILTAAHCVDMASRALVFLGAHDIKNPNEPGQIRMMVHSNNFIVFPTWNARKLKDDIALVRLPTSISYNERIQPIPLPKRNYEYRNFENKLAIASGWGRYAAGVHAISSVLRYVRLRIVDGKTCRASFPFSYRSTNICTSGLRQKSTCNGDSGGPLVLQRKKSKQRVLMGITSFGSILGCDRGYPAAFTKVASYLDWISDEAGVDPDESNWNAISFGDILEDYYVKQKSGKRQRNKYRSTNSDKDNGVRIRDNDSADAILSNLKEYPDAELFDITIDSSLNTNKPLSRHRNGYSIIVFQS